VEAGCSGDMLDQLDEQRTAPLVPATCGTPMQNDIEQNRGLLCRLPSSSSFS